MSDQVKTIHRWSAFGHDKPVTTKFSAELTRLRNTFASGRTKPVEWRIDQLKKLEKFVEDHYNEIIAALDSDLQKPRQESILFEVDFVLNDVRGALMEIEKWVKPEDCPKSLMTLMDAAYTYNEPYGVALILGAWNYPVQLVVSVLVGAIAAGNCAIVKPSEVSPATAAVFMKLNDFLDKDAFLVVDGGVETAAELLKEKFDLIFFTGSVGIGKIVYEAAAKNLTPIILELGGKSPAYVHSDADIEISAKRIIWGKCVNAGQTCVAPDYVICHKDVHDAFLVECRKALNEFFGTNPKESTGFGRIVSTRHTKRLKSLLRGADIFIGGDIDETEGYVAPTIVQNVKAGDPLMQEELFGPILPVMKIGSFDEAISFINAGDKPLAAYPFAADTKVLDRFINETSSGSVCANDTMVHLSIEALPFGGVGTSGMGRYHGKHSFDAFSNKKAVLRRDFSAIGEAVGSKRYPPYTETNLNVFKFLLKRRDLHLDKVKTVFTALMWIIVARILFSFTG